MKPTQRACSYHALIQVRNSATSSGSAAVSSPDVILDKANTALRTMRRRLKDADVYLFFNEGAEASSPTMTLRSEGRRAEIWDPQTGKIADPKATSAKGAVKIQLTLKPYETRVVVVR